MSNIQEKLLNSIAPKDKPVSVLQAENQFPTSIYFIDKPEFLDSARIACEDFLKPQRAREKLNEIYPVYMTENMYADPRVTDLVQFTAQSTWEILNSQGYNMANLTTYFTEFWCQEHYKHSAMDQHVHGNGSQIIGFYFIDVPEGSSLVQFHDPRAAKVQAGLPEATIETITHASNAVLYRAVPGRLMFAPAWLSHSFTRHGSDEPIRFIHFNLSVMPTPQVQPAAKVI
jgi:uncharacterized protein (TIGR02466 family)